MNVMVVAQIHVLTHVAQRLLRKLKYYGWEEMTNSTIHFSIICYFCNNSRNDVKEFFGLVKDQKGRDFK